MLVRPVGTSYREHEDRWEQQATSSAFDLTLVRLIVTTAHEQRTIQTRTRWDGRENQQPSTCAF